MKYMRKKCFDASLLLRYFRADSCDAAGLYYNYVLTVEVPALSERWRCNKLFCNYDFSLAYPD